MRHLKTVLTVLGAVTVLVLAGNTIVLAATGNALLLGKSNSADNITAVTRTTAGSALKLQTTSTSPPLTVNGKGKVANLNADKVDGLDSTLLHNRSYVFYGKQFVDKNSVEFKLALPSGAYNVSYSIFTNGVAEGGIQCYIAQEGFDDRYLAYSSMVHNIAGGWDPSFTGSGLVIKKSTNSVALQCNTAGAGTFDSGGIEVPIQIVATPTNIVSTKIVNNTAGIELKQKVQ